MVNEAGEEGLRYSGTGFGKTLWIVLGVLSLALILSLRGTGGSFLSEE